MTFRPPELVGVKGAFGLFNVGDAMSPRYEHGDLCWVNPALPVREGHYVAVEFKDGTAVVRRFVRRKNSQIQIEQLNPHEVVTLPADKVANLYRVIGAIEAR
jgi:phage repressor protein C with HTH and peptisase S24 domain